MSIPPGFKAFLHNPVHKWKSFIVMLGASVLYTILPHFTEIQMICINQQLITERCVWLSRSNESVWSSAVECLSRCWLIIYLWGLAGVWPSRLSSPVTEWTQLKSSESYPFSLTHSDGNTRLPASFTHCSFLSFNSSDCASAVEKLFRRAPDGMKWSGEASGPVRIDGCQASGNAWRIFHLCLCSV